MPIISEAALAKIETAMTRTNSQMAKLKEKYKKEETIRDMKMTGEALGSAALMGFLRGKFEKEDGTFNLPYVNIDGELAAGALLLGAAYLNMFGKYDEDVASCGLGIMSHYIGQVARKSAKTNTLSLVAGNSPLAGILGS